jgi:hypothetical protein
MAAKKLAEAALTITHAANRRVQAAMGDMHFSMKLIHTAMAPLAADMK